MPETIFGQRDYTGHPDLPAELPPLQKIDLPLHLSAEIFVHPGGEKPLVRLPQREQYQIEGPPNLSLHIGPLPRSLPLNQHFFHLVRFRFLIHDAHTSLQIGSIVFNLPAFLYTGCLILL